MTLGLRRSLVAIGCLLGGAALTACRETIARFVPQARIFAFPRACPDAVVAVGDSLPFHANFMIKNAPGGMQGAYDNTMLYTSDERPRSFKWRVEYPEPGAEHAGSAEITEKGVLVAKDTGLVFVYASGAGKTTPRIDIRIVPRVTAFALHPRDTTVRVGDTVFVRADAELEGGGRRRSVFAFSMEPVPHETRLVDRVEQDPDAKVRRDERDYPLVALRPGVQKVAACFAGARLDTVTIRITGEPKVANRNVPPELRFRPTDTVVYVGEEFSAKVRILNAGLNNGPYWWTTTTGDGGKYADSSMSISSPSAFGFEREAFVEHRYFAPGRYPVELTVRDSVGRTTTVRGTYTAIVREFDLVVLPPEGRRFVRLSDDTPDLAIAILSNKAKRLYPSHISGAFVLTRMSGVPPLAFGHTAFDPELDGRRRVQKDVNGDGELDDVFYIDKATLRRNGDLRAGRNRIVVTGSAGRADRTGRDGMTTTFWLPIHGVVEFEVIP